MSGILCCKSFVKRSGGITTMANIFIQSEFTRKKTLTGFKELDAKLSKLENKVAKTIVKKANRLAIKEVKKVVERRAKRMVGGQMGSLIAANVKIQVFKKQRKGSYGLRVGIKPDVPEFQGKSQSHFRTVQGKTRSITKLFKGKRWYIPAALEYGHGSARPIPFFRSAWNASKKTAVKVLGIELRKGIEREAARG
jgi:HK97 gp10 family phage protein